MKRSESGMIVDRVTIALEMTVRQSNETFWQNAGFPGLPVTQQQQAGGDFDESRILRFEKSGPFRWAM